MKPELENLANNTSNPEVRERNLDSSKGITVLPIRGYNWRGKIHIFVEDHYFCTAVNEESAIFAINYFLA